MPLPMPYLLPAAVAVSATEAHTVTYAHTHTQHLLHSSSGYQSVSPVNSLCCTLLSSHCIIKQLQIPFHSCNSRPVCVVIQYCPKRYNMPIRKRCAVCIHSTVMKIRQVNKNLYSTLKGKLNEASIKKPFDNNPRLLNIGNPLKMHFSCGTSALNMRFVQFTAAGGGPQRLGVQLAQCGDIIDVSGVDHSIPNALVQFLQGGPSMLERAKRIVAEGKSVVPYEKVKLLPPITAPDKVVCVGLNYHDHCKEQNLELPKQPMFFSKFGSCITGPFDDIPYPTITKQLDWEVEMAVVIGKSARNVQQTKAMDHVFGFTIAQDLSARDWQKARNSGQFLLGKAMDNFCPLGPAVVIKEAIPDPYDLRICTKINGVVKQEASTGEIIHKIDYIISYFSQICTLQPGDVILTGTPAGVGVHRKPPEFLKPGDVLESEITGIGAMKNTFVST